jgi:hypothetical protein
MSRRWTEADLVAVYGRRLPQAAPQKYRNTKVVHDGTHFDSKLEARCNDWLNLRKLGGEVLWFIRQVRFDLCGGVIYRADFLAVTTTGVEVIDATGHMTPTKANKLKQVKASYGVDVIVWSDKK